jgi:hypothetical protein
MRPIAPSLKFGLNGLFEIFLGIGESVRFLVSQAREVQTADLFPYRGYGMGLLSCS